MRLLKAAPKKAILFILVFILSAEGGLADSISHSDHHKEPAKQVQLLKDFEVFFLAHLQDKNVPGGAYAVVTGDEILQLTTVGHTDLSRSQSIDQDTIFRVASVSKTFAAGLAGLLVEEGSFSWEDPLTQYAPDFKIRGNTNLITVKDVVGQSTGLLPHAYDNLIEDGLPLDNILRRFVELPYICQPGSCYSYQNTAYSLIQPVVEKTATDSYANLVTEKIFKPLEMRTASIGYQPYLQNSNRAAPHIKSRGRWRTVDVKPHYYRVGPAAGVNASINDMARWAMAQLGNKPEVISPEVVAEMSQPRVRTPRELYRRHWRDHLTDAHYGLGWRIYSLGDEQIVYHGGWVAGFRADIAYSKIHNIGMVILLNSEEHSINELSSRFWALLLDKQ